MVGEDYFSHNFLFIGLQIIKGLTELHNGDSSILISYACVFPILISEGILNKIDLNARQRNFADLVGKGKLILSVIVIPNVKPSILTVIRNRNY